MDRRGERERFTKVGSHGLIVWGGVIRIVRCSLEL
jgi:hypothetical protein